MHATTNYMDVCVNCSVSYTVTNFHYIDCCYTTELILSKKCQYFKSPHLYLFASWFP